MYVSIYSEYISPEIIVPIEVEDNQICIDRDKADNW